MSNAESQSLQATQTQGNGKNVGGRPSTFNDATAYIICERIAGGETLTAICKTPGIPAKQTVHKWRRKFPSFDADYRQAREDQMESWSDDIIEIADDSTMDTVTKTGKNGATYEAVDHENIQRDRLRVSTRQFLMAKLNGRYADKVAHEHSGEVGHTHTIELSDRERMRRLATFMLEDRAAGVTVEGQLSSTPENEAIIDTQPESVPIPANASTPQTLQPSPADIIQGVNRSPQDETET